MKKYLTLFVLLLVLISLNAQEKERKKPLDEKMFSIEQQIEYIINKYPELKAESEDGVKDVVIPTTYDVKRLTKDDRNNMEIHAAMNPADTNNIIVSWMGMKLGDPQLPLKFQILYTKNCCKTWRKSQIDFIPHKVVQGEAISGGGDPVIVFDISGNAYISWLYTIVRVVDYPDEIYVDVYITYAKSTDKGATWQRPSSGDDFITSGVLNFDMNTKKITGVKSGKFPDKQWMACNPVNDDIYITLTEFDAPSNNYETGLKTWGIRRKSKTETKFGDFKLIPPEDNVWATFGAVAVNKKGIIHVVYPYYPKFPSPPVELLMHQSSEDLGETFSSPHFIDSVDVTYFAGVGQENPTSSTMYERLYPCSYLAIDTCSGSPYEGRMYVTWNSGDSTFEKKVDVYIAYSDDEGITWSEPKILNQDTPRDYGFHHRPAIFVNSNGVVVVSWYDNRKYKIPDVYKHDFIAAYSTDGGQIFTELDISEEPLNFKADGFVPVFGVGEYLQVLATTNFILTFFANYDGKDTEVYFKKTNFTGADINNLEEVGIATDKISIENVYPNPVEEEFSLVINSKIDSDISFQILTNDGKLLLKTNNKKITTGENNFQFDTANYPKGIYFIRIKTDLGVFVKKFIK